ncbi:cobyrinate a,c-diamide synthase [Pseudoflavonifractor sp. 524-17]|uniref:cobyrinate a,c-diamide synthase n=1 Tax=Pseudoflavonifractor sp. 524-17 TaxID=2304577 RepID=UPI001379A002|nr:cobyrinate a,c-diamide synthase [Pseudoflavonifractor sp. 524-17]NCE63439.1 cobyrinate a,c-diamide synthase [Pseudoflavonifractor sp. 524-17]
MMEVLIAAPASGGGKTTLTCGLLAALKERGHNPCALKCGPDYIDPMFHRGVLGVESHNLDLFLTGPEALRQAYARWCRGHSAAVCEGAMGLYDGVGGSTHWASAWHVADTLKLPVILAVRPQGASLTLAAQIRGLQAFRADSRIRGLILNDCRPALCRSLAPMLERETGLAVLGCLPHVEGAEVASRHLGLYTPAEIRDLSGRTARIARALEANVDLDRLEKLCQTEDRREKPGGYPCAAAGVRVAAASDKAFCFVYPETLEALRAAGAEPVPFSPLEDAALPQGIGGLYLPGGYPELYGEALAANGPMRDQIRAAVLGGMPTVAECGGFLYLGQSLQDQNGQVWPMAGVLPGRGIPAGKLVRFGYAHLKSKADSLLFRRGERVPVHEFHYWDSTENGIDFELEKPVTGRKWVCGFGTDTLYAAFPHLYLMGRPELAERFAAAARNYADKRADHGT